MSYHQIHVQGYLGSIEMNLNNCTYSFCQKNTAGNYCPKSLKRIYGNFENPSTITNAILVFGENKTNMKYRNTIFNYLQLLLCKHIVIDFEGYATLDDLRVIFGTINKYNIHEALLLLNYSDELYSDGFAGIVLSSNRIKGIIIFNSPFNKNLDNYIYYYENSRRAQGFEKNKAEFSPNKHLFLESLYYHTYFNRKLYIGKEGEVKNAPECKECFGFIRDFSSFEQFTEVVNTKKFQKYWHVTKDACDICRDCEYRHMCVDNRLPYQRDDGSWFHKIECNYNPYIGKWRNEEGYKTLEECGITSKPHGFSIEKIVIH